MKTDKTAIALKYAKAFMTQDGASAKKELAELAAFAKEIFQYADYFDNPAISADVKKEILKKSAPARQETRVYRLVEILIERKNFHLLKKILQLCAELTDEKTGSAKVFVETARVLDGKTADRIKKTIEKYIGKKAEMSFSLNASLIGGFAAKTGDLVIDASLSRQIENLKRTIAV